MKKIIAATILSASLAASAQVNTTCTTIGNQTNCTSVDYGQQQRQAYEAGQQMGNALGLLILRGRIAHQVHKLRDQQCHAGGVGYHWQLQNTLGQTWDGYCTAKEAGVK
jgi:hypothetical protein